MAPAQVASFLADCCAIVFLNGNSVHLMLKTSLPEKGTCNTCTCTITSNAQQTKV